MFSMMLPPKRTDLIVFLGKSLNMHTEAKIDKINTFIFLVVEVLNVLDDGFNGLSFRETDKVASIVCVEYLSY